MLKRLLVCLALTGTLSALDDPNPFAALAERTAAPRDRSAKRRLSKQLRNDPLAQPVAKVRATLEGVLGDFRKVLKDTGLTQAERAQLERDLEVVDGLNRTAEAVWTWFRAHPGGSEAEKQAQLEVLALGLTPLGPKERPVEPEPPSAGHGVAPVPSCRGLVETAVLAALLCTSPAEASGCALPRDLAGKGECSLLSTRAYHSPDPALGPICRTRLSCPTSEGVALTALDLPEQVSACLEQKAEVCDGIFVPRGRANNTLCQDPAKAAQEGRWHRAAAQRRLRTQDCGAPPAPPNCRMLKVSVYQSALDESLPSLCRYEIRCEKFQKEAQVLGIFNGRDGRVFRMEPGASLAEDIFLPVQARACLSQAYQDLLAVLEERVQLRQPSAHEEL